jgi:hypothetical protein
MIVAAGAAGDAAPGQNQPLLLARQDMEKNLVQHCCKPEWFAASHKKKDGPHLQIHQITFLLLRVGSILFFVRGCKHSGLACRPF